MGTSSAQIAANRANAQFSTGPLSEEGKQASAANSVTTGLTAARIFVRPDEQAEFEQFQSALAFEFEPQGAAQQDIFDLILHAKWNIRRCYILESQIQTEASVKGLDDALLDNELSVKLDRIYRYKKMHESTHRRATAELRQLQTEEMWRRSNEDIPQSSVLIDTIRIIRKFGQLNVVEQKVSDAGLRSQMEALLTAPMPMPMRR